MSLAPGIAIFALRLAPFGPSARRKIPELVLRLELVLGNLQIFSVNHFPICVFPLPEKLKRSETGEGLRCFRAFGPLRDIFVAGIGSSSKNNADLWNRGRNLAQRKGSGEARRRRRDGAEKAIS